MTFPRTCPRYQIESPSLCEFSPVYEAHYRQLSINLRYFIAVRKCCSKWKVREAVIKQKSMLCLISIKFSLFYLCIMINAPEGFTGNDTRNRIRLTPKLSNSEQNGHSVQYRLILNRGIGHAWKTVINMC